MKNKENEIILITPDKTIEDVVLRYHSDYEIKQFIRKLKEKIKAHGRTRTCEYPLCRRRR